MASRYQRCQAGIHPQKRKAACLALAAAVTPASHVVFAEPRLLCHTPPENLAAVTCDFTVCDVRECQDSCYPEQGGGRSGPCTRRDSVARTKDASLTERNRRICLYRRNGFTYSEIADMEQVSRVRVAQIVAQANEELGEDDGRAEIGSLLEYAERKCVDLIEHPGYVCGPSGHVVNNPDGEPMENRGVVADALKTLMTIEDRKAKLFALDKPAKRPQMTPVEAWAAAQLDIAGKRAELELTSADRQELEAFRQRASQVIPGELVKEIAPGADRSP